MTHIFWRQIFTTEYMPEMAAAHGAGDFSTYPIGVERSRDSAVDFVVKARPAAVGVELIGRAIERRITLTADKRADSRFVQQLAAKRQLCAFVDDDALFFVSQLVHDTTSFARRACPRQTLRPSWH